MTKTFIKDTDAMTSEEVFAWRLRWPNFMPGELDSWGNELLIDEEALDGLQAVRSEYGRPMAISSAYRREDHNEAVGGAERSQHLLGTAFDIPIQSQGMGNQIERIARRHGARGIGRYKTFIHIDWRKGRRATWDAR